MQQKLIALILLLAPLAFVIACHERAHAQLTSVSAQVQDTNGSKYANCSYVVDFVPNPTQATPYTYGGSSSFQTQYSQNKCDSLGNLSIQLPDNVNAISPTDSKWRFSICSATGYQPGNQYCFAVALVITGATDNISAVLQSAAPILPSGNLPAAGNGNHSVTTNLVNGGTSGNCANWQTGGALGDAGAPCGGGGGGGVSPGTVNQQAIYTSSTIVGGQTKPFYDVRDRMTCDGVTDASPAMGALVTAIGSTDSEILFPPGICYISTPTFPTNVTLNFSTGGAIKPVTSSTSPGNAVFVNGTGVECGATASCAATLSLTSGNTVIALVALYPGFTFVISSVTDSCGNAYFHAQQSAAGQARNEGAWVAQNVTGGSCTITATANGTLTSSQVIVEQFSGMGPVVIVDGTLSDNRSTGTTMNSNSATTTAGSLLIGYGGQPFTSETCTAGAGYTQPASTAGQTASGFLCAEYKLSSAGGSTSATQTISVDPSPGTWVYSMLALKPGSATINIQGGIVNPDNHQIFYNATGTNGIIDLTGNTASFKVMPEWWGASPSASSAINTPALQAWEHGAFGTNRTNSSGLAKWNKEAVLNGVYHINAPIQFYHVIGQAGARFRVTCNNGGITQDALNVSIIDGQSVAYGYFDDCVWTGPQGSSSAALTDFDFSGAQGADLAPQFLDFNRNSWFGNGLTDVGLLLSKKGGSAQGSNVYCFDCAGNGFTGAVWQVGGNNTGRNAGRFYANNALAIAWYGGDMQNCPLYGFANYGGGYIDVYGTTFECVSPWGNYGYAQAGYDMYSEASQGPFSVEHVRSEDRKLLGASTGRVFDSQVINQAYKWDVNSLGGGSLPVNTIFTGSTHGGDGAYYQVTVNGTFGGLAPTAATSGSGTTIVCSGCTFTVDTFIGQRATITAGAGNGQFCVVTSNTATTITCTAGWVTNYPLLNIVNPDNTTTFIVEPNWSANPTTSGAATFAKLVFNVIGGDIPAAGGTNDCVIEKVNAPGGQIGCNGKLVDIRDLVVTRPDWIAGITGSDNILTFHFENVLIDRGGSTPNNIRLKWSFARNALSNTSIFSGYSQDQKGTLPLVWSTGQNGGGSAADDVWIGGRSDPNSTNNHTRAILEFGGMLGRATVLGTDQAGKDTDITGGPSTGAGNGGAINFWTSNPGASNATPNSGLTRWSVSTAGHYFAGLDNTYDIGAVATSRPRTVYAATSVIAPTINASSLGGATFAAPGAIGGTTPASGAFTTLSATGQFTSTLATGTAPVNVTSTTLNTNLNAGLWNGFTILSTTDSPGAITVNAATCTDRSVALGALLTTATLLAPTANYALDANIFTSAGQAVAGTLHYRICNPTGANITLNAAATFNLRAIQ